MNELPIVAFNIGVAMDIVINNVNGNLVECFDLPKFGLAICNNLLTTDKDFMINEDLKKVYNQCKSKEEASLFVKNCL
jgi:hypothetical protein